MIETNFIDLAEQKLKEIIREKINYKEEPYESEEEVHGMRDRERKVAIKYDGFDMSGYDEAHYHNLELISRFKEYMVHRDTINWESRVPYVTFPVFWKGSPSIIQASTGGYNSINGGIILEDNLGGDDTEDIIFKCINYQNPNLLKYLAKELEEEQKIQEKDLENDLSLLKEENTEYVRTQVISYFKRNEKLVKELKKEIHNCQLCSFTFKKKNGENYNEVHHIISLSEKGKDKKINTLILCANCHRQLHYANVDISNVLNGSLIINGKEMKINEVKKDGGDENTQY